MSDDASTPRITFLGAARTVTGSAHLLRLGEQSLLVDFGMFQGRRDEAAERNRNPARAAIEADAVLLTHAHIDHAGNLPNLVKRGFAGKIHCTAATADLCGYMLRDSARIQEYDAEYLNKKNKNDPDWTPIEPLYTEKDAEATLALMEVHDYDRPFSPITGVELRLIDAGHILGSASAIMDLSHQGRKMRVAFSGDIGRRNLPILRDPTPPERPDYVVMESTYGGRTHAPATDMAAQLRDAIEPTRERKGKVIIPSFALERTQEVVFALNRLIKDDGMEPLPVYVDSPLAVNVTEVFRNHPECYDEETTDFDNNHGDPFGFEMLTMVESVESSKALNRKPESCVIISASGMCEFGRIVHHLKNNIGDPKNTVVIVGYQAPHTLGRRLVERRTEVKIFGVKRDRRCDVKVLNAFSAHADRDELLWWAAECGEQTQRYFLVHGDPDQSEALAGGLAEQGKTAHIPDLGETAELPWPD